MAEFCLNCWNELNDTHLTEEDVVLTDYLDLCEGCAEMKPVIESIGKRRRAIFLQRKQEKKEK